jgi:polyhydroxyalkanoate synthase
MDEIIMDNMLANGKWVINGTVINPALIDVPVYLVAANQDEIVPKSSVLSLHGLLKESTMFEVDGGHISYLINDKVHNLFEEYTK